MIIVNYELSLGITVEGYCWLDSDRGTVKFRRRKRGGPPMRSKVASLAVAMVVSTSITASVSQQQGYAHWCICEIDL